MKQDTFFLGTHLPGWANCWDVPLFLSARRLRDGWSGIKGRTAPWALDSGGFSELNLFGKWTVTAGQYVDEVRAWRAASPGLAWASAQDWMCEPFVLAKTGKSVREHQDLTVANYLHLLDLAPELPWVPVLQGWEVADYLRHAEAYRRAGVRLESLPVVGVGSVCRRQATATAERIFCELYHQGLRLHGFGLKTDGLIDCHGWLHSSDSMAWSLAARKKPPLPGCVGHKNCANCRAFASRWRDNVLTLLPA